MIVPVSRLKLRENPGLISPPIVLAPLYACAAGVQVIGYLPYARIDLQLNGVTVAPGFPGGFPQPDGVLIPLSVPLVAGQKMRARQRIPGATSAWSTIVTVKDFHTDYPAGPPRPEINPAPVYACGSRTGVGNLLVGCKVWLTANGFTVGTANGAKAHQGLDVAPDYRLGDHVVAHASMCNELAPDSQALTALSQPNPLPTPVFESIFNGTEQIALSGLTNGARFTVYRNGAPMGTFHTWGGRTLITISPAASAGESFTATQALCSNAGASAPGSGTVQPCSALPAPIVGPIQDGDSAITLVSYAAGARVRVYINGSKVGDGGGPSIPLSQPVADGDDVVVRQSVGSCDSQFAQQLMSQCVAPPIGVDPSALDLFPVGNTEYDGGTILIRNLEFTVKGTVYYPADSDGADRPFNSRLAALGPVPIVFMAHGNHSPTSPSHLGYDYFQIQLARMGIVACSVFLNETNGPGGGTQNIIDRSDLIIAGIATMQARSNGADPIFGGGKIDFERLGLMGHSRGGDAVNLLPSRLTLPGTTVRAVLPLAPTNFFGSASAIPNGYSFLTILPAADGDVVTNDGAVYYDTAVPSPLKSQLYVFNANHNYFNRQWLNNDNGGGLPTMARADHERILSAYGCAFFRVSLLGHDTAGYLTNRITPAGVLSDNVHLAFALNSALVVDGHDASNWVPQNSLGQPTNQTAGFTGNESPFSQTSAAFNTSFFGRSIGMVATAIRNGMFVSPLLKPTDLTGRQIWLRVAEVFTGGIPASATGFQLGLRDDAGTETWVDSDDVGGVARPFDRSAFDLLTKTMPFTLRFDTACFKPKNSKLNLKRVQAILLRPNRPRSVPLAFQDLQIQTI